MIESWVLKWGLVLWLVMTACLVYWVYEYGFNMGVATEQCIRVDGCECDKELVRIRYYPDVQAYNYYYPVCRPQDGMVR